MPRPYRDAMPNARLGRYLPHAVRRSVKQQITLIKFVSMCYEICTNVGI